MNKKNKKKKKHTEHRLSLKFQIQQLGKLNKREKLALFIGAGVSQECGLPDWNGLKERLKNKLIESAVLENNNKGIIEGIINDDENFIADLARNSFGSSFNKRISNCLYFNEITISPTLKAISTSGIKKIICFNFDDLLEEALGTELVDHEVILNGERFNGNHSKVLVFHPHGYIDRFSTDDEYKRSKIIFSKSDYEELYENHYCLTNLIQLSVLINHSVLFVGMSLRDPNTNRLLKICKEIGVNHPHYALFKKPEEEEQSKRQIEELKKIGVVPVWIKEYSEIYNIFNQICVSKSGLTINNLQKPALS